MRLHDYGDNKKVKQIAHLVIGYAVVKASLRLQNIFVYFALNYLSGKILLHFTF